jgi:hypothetical protein
MSACSNRLVAGTPVRVLDTLPLRGKVVAGFSPVPSPLNHAPMTSVQPRATDASDEDPCVVEFELDVAVRGLLPVDQT